MWEYRAVLLRIVDGDSAVLLFDQGLGGRQEEEVRLIGVSAPERPDPGGPESREFTARWFLNCSPILRWPLMVRTVPNTSREPNERRTFVRYLAEVTDAVDQDRCLNAELAAWLAQHPEWGHGQ